MILCFVSWKMMRRGGSTGRQGRRRGQRKQGRIAKACTVTDIVCGGFVVAVVWLLLEAEVRVLLFLVVVVTVVVI